MENRKVSKRAGFTLIELAIIIVILGVLGAVGAVKYADMQTEAKNAGAKAALANARAALAIAVAKDTNGVITYTEYKSYLEGASATMDASATFTLESKYSIQAEGSSTDIKSITSASAL